MPFEVYTGARPGRPLLTLVVCAALLAGTLALAWWQVQAASALGPLQQVGDLPLRVQPPKGWIADPRDPAAFVLPVRDEGWRSVALPFERRIRFEFEKLPRFLTVDELLRHSQLTDPHAQQMARPASIGPYPGFETRRLEPFRIGRSNLFRETIIRMACLPRGYLITVVYDPLIDLRPADIQILDDVCKTLVIDDRSLADDPENYLAEAGFEFPLEDNWTIVWSDFAEVPGIYVGGTVDGWPAWSIGLFRTWCANDRTPEDLLVDFAAEFWLIDDALDQIARSSGRAGATVYAMSHPSGQDADTAYVLAYVIQQASPPATAILVGCADPDTIDAVSSVAARIATNLRLTPTALLPPLEIAEQSGRTLVAELATRGATPRWGSSRVNLTFRGRTSRGAVTYRSSREPRGRNASRGYEGVEILESTRQRERAEWSLGPRAQSYEHTEDFFVGSERVRIVERRAGPQTDIVRMVAIEDRGEHRVTFKPSPLFVAPPVEFVVEGWVAAGEPRYAIVEYSTRFGPATNSVLLRTLPPIDRHPRVLIQQDFWPLGVIQTFERSTGELLEVVGPAHHISRPPR